MILLKSIICATWFMVLMGVIQKLPEGGWEMVQVSMLAYFVAFVSGWLSARWVEERDTTT